MDSQELNLRAEIIKVCKKMESAGLIAATDGNVSCRLGQDAILITPGGRQKGELAPEDLAKTSMTGELLEGALKPSTEIRMHLSIYAKRPEVVAVVHAHPPVATALTLAGLPFPSKVLPEVWLTLGEVRTAHYATPSTDEVPLSIAPFIKDCRAILLQRHGALTVGASLNQAYLRMEKLEHCARILLYSCVFAGGKPPADISASDLAKLDKLFA